MKVNKSLLDKPMTRKQFLGLGALGVISLFGVSGVIKQLASHADSPTVTTEPEAGAIAGSAAALNDATASAGKAVKFATPPTPPPINNRDNLVYGTYKPDASTVGPLPGITLTQFGNSSTSTDFVVGANRSPTQPNGALGNNQIVENMEIWGRVDIKSFTGVTIRNCIIHGTLLRGIDTAHVIAQGDNLRGATIIDSALVGRQVTVPATHNGVANPDAGSINKANEWCSGFRGGNYTVLRTEMRNMADGLCLTSQVGSVTAKGCWIHDGWFNEWTQAQGGASQGGSNYYPYAGSYYTHVDGIQFHRGRNYVFVGNRIGGTRVVGNHHATPSQKTAINSADDMFNATFMIKQEVDNSTANKIENVTIDRNWLAGGACTINMTLGNGNYFETVNITNNKFMRSTWGNQYYILRQRDSAGRYVGNFSNNVFEDNGEAVPFANGGVGTP